jgi:delta 1-pyrroline-5-carboxylate dehydrogenase
MSHYTCQLCNFNCVDKRAFTRHVSTKRHIQNVNIASNLNIKTSFKCESCDKVYNHHSSLARHKKKCAQLIITNQISDVPATVQEAIINKWKADNGIVTLPDQQHTTPAQTISNTTNSNNNITNTTNTIAPVINQTINNITNIITPFGKEDISHISFERRRDIIDRNKEAYLHLTEEIYKNEKNHNIICTDKRNGLIKYMTEDGVFQTEKLTNKIKDIIKTNTNYLRQFYEECESKCILYGNFEQHKFEFSNSMLSYVSRLV